MFDPLPEIDSVDVIVATITVTVDEAETDGDPETVVVLVIADVTVLVDEILGDTVFDSETTGLNVFWVVDVAGVDWVGDVVDTRVIELTRETEAALDCDTEAVRLL